MTVRTSNQMMSRNASATCAGASSSCEDSARNYNTIMLILGAVIAASIIISALLISSVITLISLVSLPVCVLVSILVVVVLVLRALLICEKVHTHRMRWCA